MDISVTYMTDLTEFGVACVIPGIYRDFCGGI